MSDFVLHYDVLEGIAKTSNSLGRQADEYANSLTSRVANAITSVTGSSSGYLEDASYFVNEKVRQLQKKAQEFYDFATQITILAETATRVDEEVQKMLAENQEEFLQHHESLRIDDWKADILNWLVGIKNKLPFLEVLGNILRGADTLLETCLDSIKYWYNCEGGKYKVKFVASSTLAILAVTTFVLTLPASEFVTICGVIGAGIATASAQANGTTSFQAAYTACNENPTWARIYSKQSTLSEVIRETNFNKGTLNGLSHLGADVIGATEMISCIVGIEQIGKSIKKLFARKNFNILKKGYLGTDVDLDKSSGPTVVKLSLSEGGGAGSSNTTYHEITVSGLGDVYDNPDSWLTNKPLIEALYKLQDQVYKNSGISFWSMSAEQQETIYKGLRMSKENTTEMDLFNRIDGIRAKYNIDIVGNKGTSFIDGETIKGIIMEEITKQAEKSWGSMMLRYLNNIKKQLESSKNSYVDFIDLPEQEKKAIQYSLKVYQEGIWDDYTVNALENIKAKYDIVTNIKNHPYAIDLKMIDKLIDKAEERNKFAQENETLVAISDFTEKNHIGEMFYGAVVGWAACRMTALTGEKVVAEGGANASIKYKEGFDTHLIEGSLGKGNKGVVGGHNFDEFKKVFTDAGFDIDDCIINIKEHPTIKSVYEVEYRIPAKQYGSTGEIEIIPNQYKVIKYPKTVYDPSVISDSKMLQWGQEAMENGKIEGRNIVGYAKNGLRFEGYVDETTGEITNFYPVIE